MRPSIVVLSIVILPLPGAPASAQIPGLGAGAKVRITARTVARRPYAGVVADVRADTIRVRRLNGQDRPPIALSRVTRVQVSRGTARPRWSKLAPLWLTGAGALIGTTLGRESRPDGYFSRDDTAAMGGIAAARSAC
jgi:hypothetical protein